MTIRSIGFALLLLAAFGGKAFAQRANVLLRAKNFECQNLELDSVPVGTWVEYACHLELPHSEDLDWRLRVTCAAKSDRTVSWTITETGHLDEEFEVEVDRETRETRPRRSEGKWSCHPSVTLEATKPVTSESIEFDYAGRKWPCTRLVAEFREHREGSEESREARWVIVLSEELPIRRRPVAEELRTAEHFPWLPRETDWGATRVPQGALVESVYESRRGEETFRISTRLAGAGKDEAETR